MKLNNVDFDTYFQNYPDKDGYFGRYGGVYVDDKLKEAMAEIKARTGLSLRSTVLGYIQRGGSPTMADRVLASKLGIRAVQLLKENKGGIVVGSKGDDVIEMPIAEALAVEPSFDEALYEQAKMLSL